MTAQLRAPGWYRAGAFVVLGVLFAAVLVTVDPARLRLLEPVRRRGRLGHERGRTRS